MKEQIVVFSGAGLSAESGIPTFRDSNGLWHNHKVEDVADQQGWQKNPQLVLDFYAERWGNIKKCEPNEGHKSLARLEQKYDVLHVTQNIDDLLERAGCSNVWHLHGSINDRKCEWHKSISNLDGDNVFACDYYEKNHSAPVKMGEKCPKCQGQMRPAVVWFGEAVELQGDRLEKLALNTEAFIGVGTSAQVHPAAGLLTTFRTARKKYFIDLKPPLRLHSFDLYAGKASEHMPTIVNELLKMNNKKTLIGWMLAWKSKEGKVFNFDFNADNGQLVDYSPFENFEHEDISVFQKVNLELKLLKEGKIKKYGLEVDDGYVMPIYGVKTP